MNSPRYSAAKPFAPWNVVVALIFALILVHLLLILAGGLPGSLWYYENFGLSLGGLADGKAWQPFSYALLHGDWFHLGINLLLLSFAGAKVMQILGQQSCAAIMILGVLVGGLMHLITEMFLVLGGHDTSHLIGISGACFALLFTMLTLSPTTRLRFVPVSGKNLGLGIVLGEAILWLINPSLGVPGFSAIGGLVSACGGAALFGISHACHLGGAFVGWWFARRIMAPVATAG
ncbi:MAG: rhomboid family intramembrane serine protease [Akkermansiaceae bacterium]